MFQKYILLACTFELLACAPVKKYNAAEVPPKTVREISSYFNFSEAQLKEKSAVYALENGGESLLARLWLVDHAMHNMDIQYYSFAKDVTGLIANAHMIRAADRGVKIRMIIDDAASKMYSHEVALLNSHENIEIRVYNAGVMLGRADKRVDKLSKNILRLMKRMHNKTFTVDGTYCIMGGRNIADKYYDYHKKYNYRDRDVLLGGKVVKDIGRSFQMFWDHELCVKYEELSGKPGRRRYRDSLRFEKLHKKAAATKKFKNETREKIRTFPEIISRAQKNNELIWTGSASFVSDEPQKVSSRNTNACLSNDTITGILSAAQRSIIIETPYLILTAQMEQVLRDARARGVQVKLITNSLASTDQTATFSAYRRMRKKMLDWGFELYEFKPDAKIRFDLMIPDVQKDIHYKAAYGCHAKSFVVDGNIAMVGSYNFDPRSAIYNTECICIFRDRDISSLIAKRLKQDSSSENSWQVTNEFDPDSKAGPGRKIRAFFMNVVPRKLL